MTKLNELDNGPGKIKGIPKINYGRGLRPEGTSARVAKDNAGVKEQLAKDAENQKFQKANDKLRSRVESKLKVTLTHSDYMSAWNGFPDLDPFDIIQGIAKKTHSTYDIIAKQMDKFAKEDGYKSFHDGYMDQVEEFKKKQEANESSLEEMAMDTLSHKKFGKLGWHNEGGVHKIKRNGKTIFSGTHKEASKHWATIKHITECVVDEDCRVCGQTPCNCTMIESTDKNKLRTLAHQNPEAADAAAALIRAYMDNPKKPIAQIVTKVVEETGIAKSQLMKVVSELGITFEE